MRLRTAPVNFASLPDHGDLVAYHAGSTRQDGAYTWHRTELSEQHALDAIANGHLRVTTPSGQILDFQYDRHEEHPSGDWTWIGHLPGNDGAQTILTFGAHAAFGSIAQLGKPPLRLQVRDGSSWLIETDPSKVASIVNAATRPQQPDFLVPPKVASSSQGPTGAASLATSTAASTTTAATGSLTATVVDVVLGYTPGFVTSNGGTTSGAITRLNFLVDVANAAYRNSQIDAQVRLVGTVPVNYPDNTSNDSMLEQLTGYDSASNTQTTPNAAFNGLRAARDQYGADLVSVVRKFQDPENVGCGTAWLIGGGQTGIQSSDEYFGYSVVSDGTDQGTDGKTYYCLDETLAHELGHNMGAQHDRDAAKGDNGILDANEYGAFPYSFGYKATATTGNFYTVMAYGDKGQSIYRVFSDPRSTFCGGLACGITDQADNARTLTQTIPTVATFRSTVVSSQLSLLDLVAIWRTGPLSTEVHALSRASVYKTYVQRVSTGLRPTGTDSSWNFLLGDYNGDGVRDVYAIKKVGASGRTEVHVLDGSNGYATFLLHRATILNNTGTDDRWTFKLGDYNHDGKLDIYAINRVGGSGRTDVHVLNGADNFGTFLTHRATALGVTGTDYSWKFELADYNHDGILDLYCINKMGVSGYTEVSVLNGATYFASFLSNATPTAMPRSGTNNTWDLKLGDYNGDGITDLYAINKVGTDLHVMDGTRNFGTYIAHLHTALPPTGSDSAWVFEIAH